MALENIGPVEALLGWGARAGTEAAHHSSFIMGQGVPILIVLAGEALVMVSAGHDWALFRTLGLMCEHMRLEITECSPAVREGTSALLAALLLSVSVAADGGALV